MRLIKISILFIINEKMILFSVTEIINTHVHTIWGDIFFYFFTISMLFFFGTLFYMIKSLRKRIADTKLQQQQHVAKIDNIRKEQMDTLENLRVEMLKREEDRIRQWVESEKEALHVLNGVSNLLDLTDKIGRADSEKILKKLDEIHAKVKNLKEN